MTLFFEFFLDGTKVEEKVQNVLNAMYKMRLIPETGQIKDFNFGVYGDSVICYICAFFPRRRNPAEIRTLEVIDEANVTVKWWPIISRVGCETWRDDFRLH